VKSEKMFAIFSVKISGRGELCAPGVVIALGRGCKSLAFTMGTMGVLWTRCPFRRPEKREKGPNPPALKLRIWAWKFEKGYI